MEHISKPLSNLIENIAKQLEVNWTKTEHKYDGYTVYFPKPGVPQTRCLLTRSPGGHLMYRTSTDQPIVGVLMTQEDYFHYQALMRTQHPAVALAKSWLHEYTLKAGPARLGELHQNFLLGSQQGNKLAMRCASTLNKIVNSDTVGDLEFMCLCWTILSLEATSKLPGND